MLLADQPIIVLYFESENELKFYNLDSVIQFECIHKTDKAGSISKSYIWVAAVHICHFDGYVMMRLFTMLRLLQIWVGGL